LAAEPALRPDQLSDSTLLAPGALDRPDFLPRFADRFGVRRTATGVTLGLAHFLAAMAGEPRAFAPVPADVPLPDVPALRPVALVDPTPLYASSLLSSTGTGPPALNDFAAASAEEAGPSRVLDSA
ncbi:LysR family transcriptional regulator, partial [Streptomyces rubellomurinus subsp. indigoferus]